MKNTTLFGPHFLNTPTPGQVNALVQWQPPVCLVLFGSVFDSALQRDLGMSQDNNYTPKDIAPTVLDNPSFDAWIDSFASRVRTPEIRADLQLLFDNKSTLDNTKIIGRIYIPDATVEAHLGQDVVRTAKLHHTVVNAVRKALATGTGDMSNFVDYWVIANEVKRQVNNGIHESYTTYLARLSEYELERMALADKAKVNGVTKAYGCGLFAFANGNPLLPPPDANTPATDIGRTGDYDREPSNLGKLGYWEGIANVLRTANATNGTHSGRHVLLLHQYFKPDNKVEGVTPEVVDAWVKKDKNGTITGLKPLNKRQNARRFEHHVHFYTPNRDEFEFKKEYPNLKVIVSEYGADGRIWRSGDALKLDLGWRNYSWLTQDDNGYPRYLRELRDLERENVDQSNVVLGYCLFGWGQHAIFRNYRIEDIDNPDPNPDVNILDALKNHVGEMLQREEKVDISNKSHLSYGIKIQDNGRASIWIESKHAPVHYFVTDHPGWQIFLLEEKFRPATEVTIPISNTRHVTDTGGDISGRDNVAIEIKVNKDGKAWFAKPTNATWDNIGHLSFAVNGFTWETSAQAASVQSTMKVRQFPTTTAAVSHTLYRQGSHVRFPVVGIDKSTFATAQWLQIRYTPPAASTGSAASRGAAGAGGTSGASASQNTGPRNGWVTKDSVHVYGSTSTIPRTWGAALSTVSLRLATGVTLGLNLRSGPSTGYAVLRTLPYNRNLWYAITGKDGNPATWWRSRRMMARRAGCMETTWRPAVTLPQYPKS